MRGRIFATLIVLPVLAAGVHAQDYRIKIKGHPAVGHSAVIAESAKVTISYSVGVGGNVVKEEKKVINEEKQYTEKVLEANDKGATKFTRTYRKAVKSEEGGDVMKLSYEGKTVTFERKGEQFEATGEGVDAKDLRDLARGATNSVQEAALAPKQEVPVGGTWALGKDALTALTNQMKEGMDLDGLKAQAKLAKAYKKDNQQWGTIELNVTAAVKKFGPLPLEKTLPFKMKLTLDAPIDGSSTANQTRGALTIKGTSDFEQNGQTITLNVSLTGDIRREQSKEK